MSDALQEAREVCGPNHADWKHDRAWLDRLFKEARAK